MLTTTDESHSHAQLRQNAEFKIRGGIAPGTQGWTIGTSALTLLHSLASNSTTASDALKLLHELQVHQVELDLQHEHMEENRRELENSTHHYAELYDFAPVAYFTVDTAGKIVEGNFAAARMLGVERDDMGGHCVDSLVAPDSRPPLLALLQQVGGTGLRLSCTCRTGAGITGSKWLEVVASASPRGPHCLLIVMDLSDTSK